MRAAALWLCWALGCGAEPAHPRATRASATQTADTSTTSTASAPPPSEIQAPSLAPIRIAEPRRQWLSLPGFEPALVVLPRGTSAERAKLAVVAHGAGGRPEPHCDHYAPLLGDDYLVVCTRGHPNNRHLPEPERGYFYDGHPELGRELGVLLAELASREPFASGVAQTGGVYVGYSQGATMGLLALHERPEIAQRFGGLLLVEGGAAEWTVDLAKKMAARGTRVAVVCGQESCRASADQSLQWMKRAGLDARLRHAPGAGHTYGGEVAVAVTELLPWLLGKP